MAVPSVVIPLVEPEILLATKPDVPEIVEAAVIVVTLAIAFA